MGGAALESLADAVRGSGLIPEDSGGVALVSGGADSAALLAGLTSVCGSHRVVAVHLNYSLRPDSDMDEAACGELCRRLGVELRIERPSLGGGNVQAEARAARYESAERLRAARGLDWVATGHTRTDLAETVLYRLATSPGRRALLGLPERRGHVVRPLLSLERDRVRELAGGARLPYRDDPSNEDPGYARNRIRAEVLPVLREIGPSAERAIAETRAELAEEGDLLERLAAEALERAGAARGTAIATEVLAELEPALRRLALRQLAERAAGRPTPLGREQAGRIWRLASQPEGGVVELGGGVEARVEQGFIRLAAGRAEPAAEVTLSVPGSCRFADWEVRAEVRDRPGQVEGPDTAVLDAAAIGDQVTVRAWRDGDRMRPLGLGGSKSLQDLFTDRKVPRSLRRRLPVVISGGRIAWVAGVAVSEEFELRDGAAPAAVLTARLIG
jgi:tRNA(Ile)-lysidine synthase